MSTVKIISTGSYLPPTVVLNDDFKATLNTSDEQITNLTGIKKRRFSKEESNADMAFKASKNALLNSNIDLKDICCCVVATFSPDNFTPTISCELQKRLGLPQDIIAFDMNAGCTGFIYGLHVAYGLLIQQPHKYALLVASEKITDFLNFKDRSTCVLFGDGAAAVVLALDESKNHFAVLGAKGDKEAILCPTRLPEDKTRHSFITMKGREVFKFATENMQKIILEVLEKAQLTMEDIQYVVCHQANIRIISHVYKKMNAPPEKFFVNLQDYGNTSAASIPIALDEMNQKGMLKKGNKIICVGFGAGLTWGGILINW